MPEPTKVTIVYSNMFEKPILAEKPDPIVIGTEPTLTTALLGLNKVLNNTVVKPQQEAPEITLEDVYEKLVKLERKINLIFGNAVLINGKFQEML